ncbi:MAG: RDD family protein [Chloroflexi bacterium]|nr:MAG: RDD family protein [Chloroflexota bacterium]
MSFEALYHNRPTTDDAQTYELAGFGRRFVAFIIDYVIFSIINTIATTVVFIPLLNIELDESRAFGTFEDLTPGEITLLFLAFVMWAVYHWYFWVFHEGRTPGKSAMDIRIIKVDGSRITTVDFIKRFFGYIISSLPLYLGYIWALFDRQNQTWHDKIAKTYVIRTQKTRKHVTIYRQQNAPLRYDGEDKRNIS